MAYEQKPDSGSLFPNTRMREGKQDAQYQGSALIGGVQYWVDCWENQPGRGPKFGLRFRRKDSPQGQPRQASQPSSQPSNRMSAQPSAPPRTAPAIPLGDPENPEGFNPASDPDGGQVPF